MKGDVCDRQTDRQYHKNDSTICVESAENYYHGMIFTKICAKYETMFISSFPCECDLDGLTFRPQICLALVYRGLTKLEIGRNSTKLEVSVAFRFRVNSRHRTESDRQTDRQTDGVQHLMRLPIGGPHNNRQLMVRHALVLVLSVNCYV